MQVRVGETRPKWSSLAQCHLVENLELESLPDAKICIFVTKFHKPVIPYLKYLVGESLGESLEQ